MSEDAQADTFTFGPLYDLLKQAFPNHRTDTGRLDVPRLADDLKMSAEGVYKWLRSNRISVQAAKNAVALSPNEDMAIEKFLPFILA